MTVGDLWLDLLGAQDGKGIFAFVDLGGKDEVSGRDSPGGRPAGGRACFPLVRAPWSLLFALPPSDMMSEVPASEDATWGPPGHPHTLNHQPVRGVLANLYFWR